MPEHAHLCVHTRQARQDAVKSNNAEERRQRATLVNDAAHLDSNARARTYVVSWLFGSVYICEGCAVTAVSQAHTHRQGTVALG